MIPCRILVVGGGGREHALVWKIAQSAWVETLICAPGNAGIAQIASCIPVQPDDLEGLLALARKEQINLVVIGPEIPLVLGLSDQFLAQGIPVFGPQRQASILEGSKSFAKHLCRKMQIPTADFEVFDQFSEAKDYLKTIDMPIVIKANGLAYGKGTQICHSIEAGENALEMMMVKRMFGEAGDKVVIEQFLEGPECSYFVVTDGFCAFPFSAARDYKALNDGDGGPNTGGMGAYSPVPDLTWDIEKQILREIIYPALAALRETGIIYRGILYVGLKLTPTGPKLLEFNVRFGDPETQVILPRLQSDIVPLILATSEGRLTHLSELIWNPVSAACVVLATQGYPFAPRKGDPIQMPAKIPEKIFLFHAGTTYRSGQWLTDGGRVLSVTAVGDHLSQAIERAYRALSHITFPGMCYRRDIGHDLI